MTRKTVSVVLAFLAATVLTMAAFAHSAPINVTGGNRYKALRLTPAVYNAANGDLSDLRIIDGEGQPVPYFKRSGGVSEESHSERYPLELLDAYLKDDRFYFDYRIRDEQESDVAANSIEFTTGNDNFAKDVELSGSHDNRNWEPVARDTLYSVDGHEKLAIDLSGTRKFTHYRLSLANNLEQIAFDGAALVYNETLNEEYNFIEAIRPAYTVEAGERRTLLHIEGLENLRLCDITIETGSMFRRTVTAPGGISKEFYNLTFEGAAYADTTLPMNREMPTGDRYTLTVNDGDDRPIGINGVAVRYYADEIVFEGTEGGSFTLEFGADPEMVAPVYDIARYSDEILRGDIDSVSLGEIVCSATEQPEPRDYTAVFNGVIIAVAVLLGAVLIVKLRKP